AWDVTVEPILPDPTWGFAVRGGLTVTFHRLKCHGQPATRNPPQKNPTKAPNPDRSAGSQEKINSLDNAMSPFSPQWKA
ncbi:hypothetical protein, partial [Corynebacterium sanguinis]|uniref:hypothetical protein n=1 Tax=Corynebacterium sanguinis TaxID=2594913 RepID=UPI001C950A49